jgi:diguanylate cyclase (GGDEF)-like protein
MTPDASLESGPARILLLEDQPDERAVIRLALERAGHRVVEAANLAAARQALSSGPIELVLCDLHLAADESGLDLLHELAPRSPEIAVVMLTGDTDAHTAIECLREGAFDYLLKPFKIDELRQVITRALRRKRRMIAERHHAEEQVRILSQFSSENPNPVLRVSRNGLVLYANAASLTLVEALNCRVGEKLPRHLARFIAGVLRKGERGEIQVDLAGRAFSFAVTPIKNADYVYLYGHDITRLKETERELVRLKEQAQAMALRDALTGLPNRTLLEDRLAQAIAQCLRSGKRLAVVFIDLDNFKQINDAHGHRVGDRILVEVGRCVSATVRKIDTVARWGGDELILLLPGLSAPAQARAVCERLKRTVQKKLAANPVTGALTLSMGVANYPDDASSPDTLLQYADSALYQAKARGRNTVVFYGDGGVSSGPQRSVG